MKFIRIKSIAYLFLICVLMCGCDYRNYFYTENSLKKVAEKSLEEKYGEEFVVHRVWNKSQTMFFADCSPEDNEEVIFTADIRKNGDGIVADGYAQGVVAKEVDDLLKDDFKKYFGDCYTLAFITNYYNVYKFSDAKNVSIDEYMKKVDLDDVGYFVYVDKSLILDETIDEECEFFEEVIPDMIEKKQIPDLCIKIYFTTGELKDKCKDYYSTHSDADFDLDNELDKYSNISLIYENGKLDKVYEGSWLNERYCEYKQFRENINK